MKSTCLQESPQPTHHSNFPERKSRLKERGYDQKPPPYSSPLIFSACGAVTLIPLSNLSNDISNPLQTHQVLTVLIAFLISRPFNSHLANCSKSSFDNCDSASALAGRRDRNLRQSTRRDEKGSGV